MTSILNFIALAHFFKAIYYNMFEYLFTPRFKDEELFGPVSTFFGIVETNS